MESGLEERRREEEVSARLQQLIKVQTRKLKLKKKFKFCSFLAAAGECGGVEQWVGGA